MKIIHSRHENNACKKIINKTIAFTTYSSIIDSRVKKTKQQGERIMKVLIDKDDENTQIEKIREQYR